MRILSFRGAIFLSTLLLTATYPVNRKPIQKISAPAFDPTTLTNNLTPAQALRTQELLGRGFNPCNLRANACACYDTVNFVIFGDQTCFLSWVAFLAKLSTGGYEKIKQILPFEVNYRQEAVKIQVDLNKVDLKPGDILFWGGLQRNPDKTISVDNYVHAAVYLGDYNGRHYAFQKPSLFCGPKSPFMIRSLEDDFEENLGSPVFNLPGDGNYGIIEVWRKSFSH